MTSVLLVHPEATLTVPALQAITKCNLFQKNPTLAAAPYRVQSPVTLSIFREFVTELEGNAVNITATNFTELQLLCEEFSFDDFAAKLSEFRSSLGVKESEEPNARGRIAALQEKANEHDHVIAVLQDRVRQLTTNFERLAMEVSALRSVAMGMQELSEGISALKTQITELAGDSVVQQFATEFSQLWREVSALKGQITVRPSQNQQLLPSPHPPVPPLDSRIISDFPEIFAEFQGTSFSLLW
jgi:hypothetical protein